MRYLSVCSGIEAASVAWHPLGWEPVGFAEIEKFPAQVLAHRFPGVKNYGDMTRYKEWDIEPGTIDILVGGTPCQAFSVAGLRKGLADPRGNLALTFVAMVDHYRPEWVVWENVPGVLSSNEGRDFGAFLGALGQLGYGWAYRTIDAQYSGTCDLHRRGQGWDAVPQRRRRVFVVAHSSGDPRRAAEVLFEPESLCGDPPPSREAGQKTTADLGASASGGGLWDTVGALCADTHPGAYSGQDAYTGRIIPSLASASSWQSGADMRGMVPRPTAQLQRCQIEAVMVPDVAHTLRGEGFDAGEDGTGRGTPIIPVQAATMPVRRLTPVECERLQGFPDGWTDIKPGGKETPDSPRYKALGNSMAVPVMRWIGMRIAEASGG